MTGSLETLASTYLEPIIPVVTGFFTKAAEGILAAARAGEGHTGLKLAAGAGGIALAGGAMLVRHIYENPGLSINTGALGVLTGAVNRNTAAQLGSTLGKGGAGGAVAAAEGAAAGSTLGKVATVATTAAKVAPIALVATGLTELSLTKDAHTGDDIAAGGETGKALADWLSGKKDAVSPAAGYGSSKYDIIPRAPGDPIAPGQGPEPPRRPGDDYRPAYVGYGTTGFGPGRGTPGTPEYTPIGGHWEVTPRQGRYGGGRRWVKDAEALAAPAPPAPATTGTGAANPAVAAAQPIGDAIAKGASAFTVAADSLVGKGLGFGEAIGGGFAGAIGGVGARIGEAAGAALAAAASGIRISVDAPRSGAPTGSAPPPGN